MNLGKLIVIVGLPGSGKSTLVRAMGSSASGLCCEDFHADAIDHSPLVEHGRHYDALLEHLRAGSDCIIADTAFCDPQRTLRLQETIEEQLGAINIRWIYFENAPEKCRNNVLRRGRESLANDLAALETFRQLHRIPTGITPLPVCKSTWPPTAAG